MAAVSIGPPDNGASVIAAASGAGAGSARTAGWIYVIDCVPRRENRLTELWNETGHSSLKSATNQSPQVMAFGAFESGRRMSETTAMTTAAVMLMFNTV